MRRVVVDNMVIDHIDKFPGAYEVMRSSVDRGNLRRCSRTSPSKSCAAIPDKDQDKRSRLLVLLVGLGRLIPTGAFVLGSWAPAWAVARLTSDGDAFETFRSRNVRHINHTRDALVAATAQFEGCALVTDDQRLTKRARERGLEVITPKELLAELGFDVQSAQTN